MTLCCCKIDLPFGTLFIAADETYLRAITFSGNEKQIRNTLGSCKNRKNSIISRAIIQLQEYFDGTRTEFDLPIGVDGTDFQKKSWAALLTIPYGETLSYQEQAQILGHPGAARAVGTANGCNPISIVIPCHRVIRKSGSPGGYAGGIEQKNFLLNLEKAGRNN